MNSYFLKTIVSFVILLSLHNIALGKSDKNKNSINELTGELTLRQVVTQVLMRNPELKAYSLEIRAREARILQAGLRPNPQILLDTQDILGSGGFSGADQSQSTITLSQIIELGGKRTRREKEAIRKRDLAQWDYETNRMDVLTRVAKDFIEAVAAQEKLLLTKELVNLSKNLLRAVKEKVTAGKVSPIQKIKAEVALSSTRIQYQQAFNQVQKTYRKLATSWGSTQPQFKKVVGDLFKISSIPKFETLKKQLLRNPQLARWAAEVTQRQAKLDLELANAKPNLRVGAGGRWFQETKDNTFIFEFSFPLQFFDRNQGAIAEARHRLAKIEQEKKAITLQLHRNLSEKYLRLINAHQSVIALKKKVLPGAQTAFEATQEGYQYGKFGYLEILDSQRTLFDARAQYINALLEYHQALADVERLIGKPLSQIFYLKESNSGGPNK